ncbi:MAG TPA: hypothetical protein VMD03_09230 [Steroidobacteraceae bacterium]|nr:hypothetical protein [Steroidobacteraceae bacterium]
MSEAELVTPGIRRPTWAFQSWLRAESLDGLAELNEQCLELLCEQATAGAGRPRPALLATLEPLWRALDASVRRRAARCPFLLLDAGFARAAYRRWPTSRGVHDRGDEFPYPHSAAFFTVPRTVAVTRLVLTYAWHLARSESVAARLFLGMSPVCAERVAACTLRQVIQLAENEPRLLAPRWPDRLHVWRDLLVAASGADAAGMERFCMRGLQLLAADARSGDQGE